MNRFNLLVSRKAERKNYKPVFTMKAAFFAHQWQYINNFSPVLSTLSERGCMYDILIASSSSDTVAYFFKKYPGIIDFTKKSSFRYIHTLQRVPIVGGIFNFFLLFLLFRKYIRHQGYTHVVVSDDRNYIARLFLYAAYTSGLFTVLYPTEDIQDVSSWINEKMNLDISRKRWMGEKIFKKIVKRFSPAFVKTKNNRDVFFNVPTTPTKFINYVVFKACGFEIKNPWVRGSGLLSRVAVNSRQQANELLAEDVPVDRLALTGFPPHDNFFSFVENKKKIQTAFGREFHCEEKKIFLIIGTHIDQIWPKSDFPQIHSEMNMLCRSIDTMLGGEYQIVFKVHPRQNMEDQKNIFASDLREKIIFVKSERSVYELIALSDAILLFLSSTALATLGTNVSVMAYQLKEIPQFGEWYKQFPSILQTTGKGALEGGLKKIKDGIFLMDNFLQIREEDKNKYLFFDGKNSERFVNILTNKF